MNTPKIRFKGFTDDWEQRKLGDVLICLQNNSFSRADLSNETGVAKNVHYGDVLVKFGEVLDVSKEQLPMISDERVLIKYKASFLQNGDVIVADTAEDSTVGKCSEIAGLNNEIVLSGLHTIPYRPKEKFASGYLGYYLNSDSYHNQLIPLMQGIKVTAISKSALRDTDIIYPESKEEQAKIGNYFQSLDHLITLHQRKCDETKQLKKFMLQKMFPKNGEKNPEIRFKGFTDDWEQRKVGEVTKELLDYDNFSSGLPLLTSSRSGLMYQSEYRGNATTENENTLFSVVPLNACTYRHMSDDSTFHLNINTLEKGLVSKEYPVFQENESNLKFIVQYINSSNSFTKFCTEQKKGGTRTRLYYKTLCEYKLMMPSIKEQNKTANFFDTLDHLITLHQRKCEKLKELKKFMLQNMFV